MPLTNSKYTVKEIDDLRTQYVKQFRKTNGGKQQVKYLGVVSPESIAEEGMEQFKKKTKGTELLIEYHMFEMKESGIPIISQWRLVDPAR